MAQFDYIYSQLTLVTFDFFFHSFYREHIVQKKTIQIFKTEPSNTYSVPLLENQLFFYHAAD